MNKYIHTKLKGSLTAIIMMVGLSAWAQSEQPEQKVAKIGDTEYETLQAAIEAANDANEGTTITLLTDVTISEAEEKLTITKPLTLDMASHTITSSIEEPFLVDGTGEKTGTLAITGNGTIAGPTGSAAASLDGKAMITVQGSNAHLTFLNGTMTCGGEGSDGMYGVYILESGSAEFGVQSDKTGPSITAWFAAIGENNTTAPANITIYGGTYKQDATPSESNWWEYFCAPVYASASGTVTIEGGTFTGRYAFASRYGNVAQNLNISGGEFNGSKSALLIGNVSGDGASGDRIIGISGGSYSSPIPSEYCSSDFSPLIGEDGKCTVASTSTQAEAAEALSNGSYYNFLGSAITAAGTEATGITILKDPTAETIAIPATANITLTIADGVTLSKPITNAGTLTIWDGSNAEGTSGVISGTITNTGTLNISDNANVSGTITATDGSVTVSGGTISSTIITSGTSALTISNGSVSDAITVGGSGTNQVSGGTFTAAVNATATATSAVTLTISGGTFSNTITATGTDDSHKGTINISGGTFTSTITEEPNGDVVISGGTHSVLPTPTLCADGYMPVVNDGTSTTYDMTNEWAVVDDTDLTANPHLADAQTYGTYSVATATYTRNSGMVSAGNAETKYGTICLPFDLTEGVTGINTLYKATNISVDAATNSGTLTIEAVTPSAQNPIPAGTPLIFELGDPAKRMTVTSSNAKVDTKTLVAPTDGNLLRGTYTELNLTSSTSPVVTSCYYLNGDAFHQAKVSLKVPAFRAYLYQAPQQNGAPMPSVLNIKSESNEETGLTETFEMEDVTEVFDLNGRKQNGLQKGLNIVRRANGSTFKVIVK